jgi:uncharacterized protein with HEPN domain
MPPDLMPLVDICTAIDRALGFVQGFDVDQFHEDKRTRWAVYSQVIVVGDAARRITGDYPNEHPEIPWAEIIGMGNKLAHDYDNIDWCMVWDTVRVDFPKLKSAIEPLIPNEPQ